MKLRRTGCNIIIATPGRLLDLLTSFSGIDLKSLELLVLDEADKLLDMGFSVTLSKILQHLPKQRRTGLFSATQTQALEDWMRVGMRNPVRVRVAVAEKKEKEIEKQGAGKYVLAKQDSDSDDDDDDDEYEEEEDDEDEMEGTDGAESQGDGEGGDDDEEDRRDAIAKNMKSVAKSSLPKHSLPPTLRNEYLVCKERCDYISLVTAVPLVVMLG